METQKERKLLAIIFTDIEGFSAMTQKNEEKALEFVERYRDVVSRCTQKYRGKIVHFFGDGSLSFHQSAVDAVHCALEIQADFTKDPMIPVRIGIHLGEVVITDETIYGNAVNITSRLQNMAPSHSILISGIVAKEIHNRPEISLSHIGKVFVKNIKEPIDVYAISNQQLVVPSKKDIHQFQNAPVKLQYLISLIIGIGLAGFIITKFFEINLPWSKKILDKRILVLPFENTTGDSTLSDLSHYMAAYLSNLLESVDDIKLVSIRNIISDPQYESFGVQPYNTLTKKTNAQNFIDGHFRRKTEDTIGINVALVNGSTGEYLKQFPEQPADKKNIIPGLVQLSQKITGFLISADFQPLSLPRQDAFRAYLEARRVWGVNNFEDSRQLLLKAIEYDSTFIDAYYDLSDTYYNSGLYQQSDSIMQVILRRFDIATQTSTQKNHYYYYSALHAGKNKDAFKYLLEDYHKDEQDIFRNTTTASFALYFVNDPKSAIRILRNIPFSHVDFEFPDNRFRITMGIQAYYSLKKYRKAVKLAQLYPSSGMTIEHHKMKIRALAGIMDTTAINEELFQVGINFRPVEYAEALHWTGQQFTLQKQKLVARKYQNDAYQLVREDGLLSGTTPMVYYDLGYLKEGLIQARQLYEFAPYAASYVCLAGIGYAKMAVTDSVNVFMERLKAPEISEYYPGESEYQQAILYVAMGDKKSAMIKLLSAIDHGAIFYKENMEFDPYLMPIFDEPDFQKIIHPLEN